MLYRLRISRIKDTAFTQSALYLSLAARQVATVACASSGVAILDGGVIENIVKSLSDRPRRDERRSHRFACLGSPNVSFLATDAWSEQGFEEPGFLLSDALEVLPDQRLWRASVELDT